jgi:hypothetical protein
VDLKKKKKKINTYKIRLDYSKGRETT